MSALEKVYNFLSFEITEPKTYGIFHFVSLAIIVFLTIIISKNFKYCSEKTERKIAFWFWIVLFAFEAYKQFIYLFDNNDVFSLDYDWNGFPFQLCSSPLYVLPAIAFLPEGKIREAFVAYYGTFVLLGGVAVCIYPGTVFVETLGIDIHTMIWHGSQVFLGVFFNLRRFLSENSRNVKKYYLSAVPIFLSFVAVAMILNESVYALLSAKGADDTFNMFYISPHFDCVFPILDTIQAHAPYLVFLLSYLAVLCLFSFAVVFVEWFLAKKFSERRASLTDDSTKAATEI